MTKVDYYDRSEQETTINFEPYNGCWEVYSCYPPHIKRLLEIGEIVDTEIDGGGNIISIRVNLDMNQIRLFKPSAINTGHTPDKTPATVSPMKYTRLMVPRRKRRAYTV